MGLRPTAVPVKIQSLPLTRLSIFLGRRRRAGCLAQQPRAGMTGKTFTLLGLSFSRVWLPRPKNPGLFRIRIECGGVESAVAS
jgi:hypothetical protein